MTDELKRQINGYIELDWSPEQVSGYLKKEGEITVYHETIYQYIFVDKKAGGMLYQHGVVTS
jgi:IS30 family transposase